MRGWRNWQTRYLEVVVGASPWRFESSPAHNCYNKLNKLMVEKMPTPGESEEEQHELFDEEEVTDEDAKKVIKLSRKPGAEPGEKEEEHGEKQHEMFGEEELMDPDRDPKKLLDLVREADARAKEEKRREREEKRNKRRRAAG